MTSNLQKEINAALRYAKSLARTYGLTLGRFRRVYSPASERGGEWLACALRGDGYVTAWRTVSWHDVIEAVGSCNETKEFNGKTWGFSIRLPSPKSCSYHDSLK